MATIKTFIGVPTYNGQMEIGTAAAIMRATSNHDVHVSMNAGSALALGFNRLLCEAMNRRAAGEGITHFCLLHADLFPEDGDWLGILHNELANSGREAISAVVPIKDERGLTSTGTSIGTSIDSLRVRRLTLREVDQLPQTFGLSAVMAAGFGPEGGEASDTTLLINTGLLLIDLSAPWITEVSFGMTDTILVFPNGQRVAAFDPEDWRLSKMMRVAKARYGATRAVKVRHVGRMEFPNYGGWGTLEKDTGDKRSS